MVAAAVGEIMDKLFTVIIFAIAMAVGIYIGGVLVWLLGWFVTLDKNWIWQATLSRLIFVIATVPMAWMCVWVTSKVLETD